MSLPGVKDCTACRLRSTCTQVVPGSGPKPAKVMILGEAPGADEDLVGRPFIGRSGQLLRDTLESLGINPEDCYITNAVKCRPPGNRTPKTDEIAACNHWLAGEIEAVRPERIICMGAAAGRALFGSGVKHKYALVLGKGKKGQDRKKEPTLDDLRRRDDLLLEQAWPVIDDHEDITRIDELPDVTVQMAFHPAAALRSPRMRSGFVRDIEKLAEALGIREQVDQSRDYQELDPRWGEHDGRAFTGPLALDTEFEEDGSLVCYSFSNQEGVGRVVFGDQPYASSLLANIVTHAPKLILHNAKADVPVICDHLGWPLDLWPWHKTEDTIVMAYILGKRPLALKALAENVLGLKVIRLDDVRDQGERIADIPREKLVAYSAQDADITLRLYARLKEELESYGP